VDGAGHHEGRLPLSVSGEVVHKDEAAPIKGRGLCVASSLRLVVVFGDGCPHVFLKALLLTLAPFQPLMLRGKMAPTCRQ
jgi:hypothetical protein